MLRSSCQSPHVPLEDFSLSEFKKVRFYKVKREPAHEKIVHNHGKPPAYRTITFTQTKRVLPAPSAAVCRCLQPGVRKPLSHDADSEERACLWGVLDFVHLALRGGLYGGMAPKAALDLEPSPQLSRARARATRCARSGAQIVWHVVNVCSPAPDGCVCHAHVCAYADDRAHPMRERLPPTRFRQESPADRACLLALRCHSAFKHRIKNDACFLGRHPSSRSSGSGCVSGP